MQVLPLTSALTPPSLGMLLGTMGSRSLLDRINTTCGGSVIFGQAGDPLASRYETFMSSIVRAAEKTSEMIKATCDLIMGVEPIKAITCKDDLLNVPAVMQPHLVQHPSVRTLLEDGRIWGWGYDPASLPEPDQNAVGRLVRNGEAILTPGAKTPTMITHEWLSTDPRLTLDDIDAYRRTFEFIDGFIAHQLGEDGERLDPTSLDSGGRIGRKK